MEKALKGYQQVEALAAEVALRELEKALTLRRLDAADSEGQCVPGKKPKCEPVWVCVVH